MKVLLTNHNFSVGGVKSFMYSLSSALQTAGHHCELFFFEKAPAEHFVPANFKTHFGDLADFVRLVKSEGFEVVHANNYSWWTGISAAREIGAKVIVTSHGRVGIGKWTFGWNSADCDAFTACSNWVAKELQPHTDLPIKVVLNGIDTAKFKPAGQVTPHQNPIVAWVGRGDDLKDKRIDRFAAIGPRLHDAGLRLWVADPCGEEKLALKDPLAAATLRPVAERWGGVPSDQMPAFYREVAASGGCIVSTSSSEGLPLTLLEAQACGCPVIAPDVRGVNECVDPEHGGVLYASDTPTEQLADLVLDTLRDKVKLQWRQAACARYAHEHFSLTRMAQDYSRIYREAPFKQPESLGSTGETRRRLAPFLRWRHYVEFLWKVGLTQYQKSVEMAERGDWMLASSLARASFSLSPTIYLKPKRMSHLIKTQWHRTAALKG